MERFDNHPNVSKFIYLLTRDAKSSLTIKRHGTVTEWIVVEYRRENVAITSIDIALSNALATAYSVVFLEGR